MPAGAPATLAHMVARRLIAAGTESIGESPLWPSAAIVTSAVLYADLPRRFIAGSSAGAFTVVRWVVPALTVLRPRGPRSRPSRAGG